MKKFLLVIAAALMLGVSAKAEGYVGGTVGFLINGGSFSGMFAPEGGYNFNKHISAGGFISLAGNSGVFRWNINPYFRYTFTLTDRFGIFGDATVGVGTTKYKGESSLTNWDIMICPGVKYQVSDHICIYSRVCNIGYQREGNGGAFQFALNFSPTCGVYYCF